MIGLTAGLSALVGAFGTGFTAIMPTIMICALGPAMTFSFLHKLWEYLQKCFLRSKTKNDSSEYWELYPVMRDSSKDGIDDGTEVFWDIKERTSKNGRRYYEVNGDKFFLNDSGWDYVIPKDGLPYSTDEAMLVEGAFDKVQYHENQIDSDRFSDDGEGIVKDWGTAFDRADDVWLGSHKIK